MKRTGWLILSLVYLVLVVIVAIFVWPRKETLALTMPVGDAILGMGVLIGGLTIVGLEILTLWKDRQRLLAETRNLESVIQEQYEFRRALEHELRNPITAISMGVERLSAECDADTVKHLEDDIERVTSLLETVSALARLEKGPIEFAPVKLDEVVQQAVDTIRATPPASERKWEVDLPAAPFPLPPIQGNDDLLFIALLNLLGNAVKFTRENGKIIIRAFEDGDMVVLQVSDNGIGIRKEDIPNVFKAFTRGQDAKNLNIRGSGLGLYQVRKIVERHGGQVLIDSKVSEGTKVTIRLPVGTITKP
jgi:two-component system OmpR family sensor kinase